MKMATLCAALLFVTVHLGAQQTKPPFEGSAQHFPNPAECIRFPVKTTGDPFMPQSTEGRSIASYRLTGCWRGDLRGKPFVIDEYWSTEGGGLAVRYGNGPRIGYLGVEGPPDIARFTGTAVCDVEHAGARFQAIDIVTRRPVDYDFADNKLCPYTDAERHGAGGSGPLGLTPLITITSYLCGSYSVFLTGMISQYPDDITDESVLFVAGEKKTYTLSQLSSTVSDAKNVDHLWQCSAASADSGCTMKAQLIRNGMHTPDSLSLQDAGKTIACEGTESAHAYVRTQMLGTEKQPW